ncbi:MAG: hypothetical protein M0008_06635 [Actinomycetota bacterium]|nr:hypothetical protein [Actinomycetota bacterium]
MHLERNATWGFAFGDRCFGPFCDSLHEPCIFVPALSLLAKPTYTLDAGPGLLVPPLAPADGLTAVLSRP